MNSLFIEPEQSSNKNTAVLLVDSSYSIASEYRNGMTILDKMLEVITNLPADSFKVIFWNSDNAKKNQSVFINGIYRIPFVVDKSKIKYLFGVVKKDLTSNCLTFPHLGFADLSKSGWLQELTKSQDQIDVYFLTDGEIGYANCPSYNLAEYKNKFKSEIEKIVQSFNTVRLNILAVEETEQDMTIIETTNSAAGCDIFQIIRNSSLTGIIAKFVSYNFTYPDGFVHMEKLIVPQGFASYKNKIFSQLKTSEFLFYVGQEIHSCKNDDELLTIAQALTVTVTCLIKNKSPTVAKGIVTTFCNLFQGCESSELIKFILADAINQELDQKAGIFADYKAKLKNLYTEADKMLHGSVASATALSTFVTLPINGQVIVGEDSDHMVDQSCTIGGCTYKMCAIKVKESIVPILTVPAGSSNLITQQCARQWIRTVVASFYNEPKSADVIIYLMVGLLLKVRGTSAEKHYRSIVNLMLQKKRNEQTELEYLESGALPVPQNGNQFHFANMLNKIKNVLELFIIGNGRDVRPMTVWYILCLLTENVKIINNQLIHCKADLEFNYPDVDPSKLLDHVIVPVCTVHDVPQGQALDYNCLITLNDVSDVGGYIFNRHTTSFGQSCSPISVFSAEGYDQMKAQENLICPICYTRLSEQEVTAVPKRQSFDVDFGDYLLFGQQSRYTPMNVTTSSTFAFSTRTASSTADRTNSKLARTGTLVILKGTVGSGKTTFGFNLKNKLINDGHAAIVEGMDKYTVKSMSRDAACVTIKQNALDLVDNNPGKNLFVIFDMCNEKEINHKNPIIFGVNFVGWKMVAIEVNFARSRIAEYLAWSLRNVLTRPAATAESLYSLNPVNAGISTCINVHMGKAKSLFGKKIPLPSVAGLGLIDQILEILKGDADNYADYIRENSDMIFEKEYTRVTAP